jgi:hypothetical protein
MVGETAHEAHMFRFWKPETPRAPLLLFLGNETRANSGFVSYVSFFLCFDFDPNSNLSLRTSCLVSVNGSMAGELFGGCSPVDTS